MMRVRYFAAVREALALDEEEITEPCTSVCGLLRFLQARGHPWSTVLTDETLLIAVNQTLSSRKHPLQQGDEVAIFPPVTGG